MMTIVEQCLLTLAITVPFILLWVAYEIHCVHLAIEANGNRAAAASEMLATLKSLRGTLMSLGGDSIPTLDAVIAKAEGTSGK